MAEVDLVARRDRAIVQILSGAKAAAGAGQHQHSRLGQVGERVRHLLVHLDGEAVQPVGAVQGQAGNAALQLEVYTFISHGRT